MTAKELFEAFESGYPDPKLMRRWEETTERERAQWEAVARAVARSRTMPERAPKLPLEKALDHSHIGPPPARVNPSRFLPPAPEAVEARAEMAQAIFWLLRAYESGHRQGWEAGPSTQETMDGLFTWLCAHGFDPTDKQTPTFVPEIARRLA